LSVGEELKMRFVYHDIQLGGDDDDGAKCKQITDEPECYEKSMLGISLRNCMINEDIQLQTKVADIIDKISSS